MARRKPALRRLDGKRLADLLTGQAPDGAEIELPGYGFLWLK